MIPATVYPLFVCGKPDAICLAHGRREFHVSVCGYIVWADCSAHKFKFANLWRHIKNKLQNDRIDRLFREREMAFESDDVERFEAFDQKYRAAKKSREDCQREWSEKRRREMIAEGWREDEHGTWRKSQGTA